MAAPLCGYFVIGGCLCFFPGVCLAVSGILGGCFVTVGSLVPSLVDALLPRACGPSPWRMLDRRGHLVFVGGCFVANAAGCSYALSGWMLCHYRLCRRSWVLRAVALLSFFSYYYIYSKSLITRLLVCKLCYEGASYNSLLLIKNRL
jgi:hypothetical protein